ncbi:MAG: VOC family protein [Bacteroidota bacterium]
MKLGYTILYVPNVAEAVLFYEQAFGFERLFMTPEQDYAELNTGETTLAFASIELGNTNLKQGFEPVTPTSKPAGFELALVTDHIDEDFARAIEAGATLYESVVQKPWGQKVGYVRDLNGFLIEICTPIPNNE